MDRALASRRVELWHHPPKVLNGWGESEVT
jgi:hypothetical protein